MKLYELTKGDKFKIKYDDASVPEYTKDYVFEFSHVDGAYSVCFDQDGNIQHLAAYAPVIVVSSDV